MEDFFREVTFDYEQVALLLLLCLGTKGKIRLCIDRTEWDFGSCQVNILMIIACNGKTHVPLYWELLDNKSGNSNAEDRIELLQKVINIIGKERIGILIADREFIGQKWIKYLKDNKINFCIRVPKHHSITRSNGEIQYVGQLTSKQAIYFNDALVDGVWVNVYLQKLDNDDYLFLIGNIQVPKYLGQIYKRRWTIEICFQSFKSRGFHLEDTHLKDLKKLKKLIALVSIAFAICINLGIHQHEKIQKIKIKKHGYKSKSFCRIGIDIIRDLIKQPIIIFERAIKKFLRYLKIQKEIYQKYLYINYLK